jgi:hypothetical protein
MTTIHHDVEITTAGFTFKTYGAHCTTCGWVSRRYESKRDAMNDGDEHSIASADQVTTAHQS